MIPVDLLVVGGGINGAAIARAAALGGASVLLVERGDLAQATSSASTKLMHGGLRYLEQYEFGLVRKALKERAIGLKTAPHLIRPLEFRLPHDAGLRPWPIVSAGLLLYDLLAAGGGLPRSRAVTIDDAALKGGHVRGFSYWDGWADDARLVVANAIDAADHGADIRTRTALIEARRDDAGWRATIEHNGVRETLRAATLVNAGGPWVARLLAEALGRNDAAGVRLVRGTHIVLRRVPAHDWAYLFQQPDGRVVFAIPYEERFTMIGTTDAVVERAEDSAPSAAEIDYLIDAANAHLADPVGREHIAWAFGGIRALHDDGEDDPSEVTRDYRLVRDGDGAGQLLSVFGGKLTTARALAEEACRLVGIVPGDTARRPLPGGDIGMLTAFEAAVARRWPFLGAARARRMARAYGSRIERVLAGIRDEAGMGEAFGGGLTRVEVDHLVHAEWARTAEDVLWRRTKLGLELSEAEAARLGAAMTCDSV